MLHILGEMISSRSDASMAYHIEDRGEHGDRTIAIRQGNAVQGRSEELDSNLVVEYRLKFISWNGPIEIWISVEGKIHRVEYGVHEI